MTMRTHYLGVKCDTCYAVVEPDTCCPEPHGYGYQWPTPWAARAWPDHPCFQTDRSDTDE